VLNPLRPKSATPFKPGNYWPLLRHSSLFRRNSRSLLTLCASLSNAKKKPEDQIPCSCGAVVYDGYDFIGNHKTWMGASVWDNVLRSLVSLPEVGQDGEATWPHVPPPPPPPAPGPFWNLRVFSSHYPLMHAPDLNRYSVKKSFLLGN
jgi:hypothetical protein